MTQHAAAKCSNIVQCLVHIMLSIITFEETKNHPVILGSVQ